MLRRVWVRGMKYAQEKKALERKHGRHFPNLRQARVYDEQNPSLIEIRKANECCAARGFVG